MAIDYFLMERIKRKLPFVPVVKGKIVNTIRRMKSDYGRPILEAQVGNNTITQLIKSGNPLMVARLGATELECVTWYLRNRKKGMAWGNTIKKKMLTLSGFFPPTDEMLDRFSIEFLEHVKQVDIMGVWYNPNEDHLCRNYCDHATLTALQSLEPYYHNQPWSAHLLNKKVLVIHPYDETISHQYKTHGNLLFNNQGVLPKFHLETLKAVQSLGGGSTSYKNWFEACDAMCEEITKRDFDIALVGAGAYGLPLASFVKKIGKQAIHIGGATQILFGIKGKRWDDHKIISRFYNEYWTRPSKEDTPSNFKNVENGCYW
ncbi:hypothetical protein BG53_11530 [Paenibacillus darwinianus]|uniref:Uncharacterized protein n=1 Tax=Paenibacillus darwinianus TaxID=1380763 RepID=A0A9W5S3X2_9BACL|nr:hypothetical protein [Paenibacillus darwinianus]EXX91450.1 hypothetical protein BG53_11530 [Paenibacillus darwinianus]